MARGHCNNCPRFPGGKEGFGWAYFVAKYATIEEMITLHAYLEGEMLREAGREKNRARAKEVWLAKKEAKQRETKGE